LAPALIHYLPHDRVIVSFVDGVYDPTLVTAEGGKILREFENLGMLYASIPPDARDSLSRNPSIEFLEIDSNFVMEVADVDTSVEYSDSWGLEEIGAEPVHLLNYTGRGVKIAVLDTGVDYNHLELAQNYKGGYDFINKDDDPMDDNGHGTHVAGIIAAARDGIGILGVAPDAEIYSLKVSDARGKGSFSGLVEGIGWAIENNMDIVTMSITGDGGSMSLDKAVNTAYEDYGIVLLAAVGNGASGSVLYPAAYGEVIGVGAVTSDGEKSSFSLTGSEVELVAPGSGIKSTAIGNNYRVASGTSMATPFVAGAAALLLSTDESIWKQSTSVNGDGEWTNDEVRIVLREMATDLGPNGKDNMFGYGLLNLRFPGEQADYSPTPESEDGPIPAQTLTHESLWFKFIRSLN
ncbi:MAG: S8 family peptidase, partial [Nitrososphaera sp.]|nr:S8 family peptidase [Nitrososphaera sp.]